MSNAAAIVKTVLENQITNRRAIAFITSVIGDEDGGSWQYHNSGYVTKSTDLGTCHLTFRLQGDVLYYEAEIEDDSIGTTEERNVWSRQLPTVREYREMHEFAYAVGADVEEWIEEVVEDFE